MAFGENIDLTSVPSRVYDHIIRSPTNFNINKQKLRLLGGLFNEQRAKSDAIFNSLLHEHNANLLTQLDKFIDTSMEGGTGPFPERRAELISAATLILGMQMTDHKPTFKMIENYIRSKLFEIEVVRIEPTGLTHKQKNIISLTLDKVEEQKHLLVIVERSEAIDFGLLQLIVSALYDNLQQFPQRRIMALFCVSGSWSKLTNLLPNLTNRMSQIVTIVKEPSDTKDVSFSQILEAKGIILKPGPQIMRLINTNYTERNASITNLKYIFQHALTEHCVKSQTLASLPPKDFVEVLKQQGENLIDILKNLDSIRNSKESFTLDWNDPSAVAKFCHKRIKNLKYYHKFSCSQISYYMTLLKDETMRMFPLDSIDIYEELFNHYDLGHSKELVDAVNKLNKLSRERLLMRIEKCTMTYSEAPSYMKNCQDVYSILIDYKEKLENNDECSGIIANLVVDLLRHLQTLENPLRQPLGEVLYFNSHESITQKTMPATRLSVREASIDGAKGSVYFNTLFRLIHNCAEEISINDLFEDFNQDIQDVGDNEPRHSVQPISKVRAASKKARRSVAAILDHERSNTKIKKPKLHDKELTKAIFIDHIDHMITIGLLKRDTRSSQKGILKRCMWL